MFCVIQEIALRKPNQLGEFQKLSVTSSEVRGKTKYSYEYGGERFERPEKKAYKISIHESKRINGVVTKKQFVVTTIGYYDLVEDMFFDCIDVNKLSDIAKKLNADAEKLLALVKDKLLPLQRRIMFEYRTTKEYKTREKHKKIINKYYQRKLDFMVEYFCDPDMYDYCYDIYGKLMNKDILDEVIKNSERSYREHKRGNYAEKDNSIPENGNDSDYYDYDNFKRRYKSDYSYYGFDYNSGKTSRTPEEKGYLKRFYKSLAAKFHPDANPNSDTTKEMQFLNKLKDEWGI